MQPPGNTPKGELVQRALERSGPEDIPVLKTPRPVRPGEVACIRIALENDDPNEAAQCGLSATDLIAGPAHRTPAATVSIFPRTVTMPPGDKSFIHRSMEYMVQRES